MKIGSPGRETAWSTSTLHRLADRPKPNPELFTRSRITQLLATALEPPENPPTESGDEDETDDR